MDVINWGEIEYGKAQEQQLLLVEEVFQAKREEVIVFCSHPPVVTLGRGTKADDIDGWQGSTFESTRGGRATYHGPNQLVIYPILNLSQDRKGFASKDIHAYLRGLEKAAVLTLSEFGLSAEAKTVAPADGEASFTGVWIANRKVASIGIAVKKWISYHGIAINVDEDRNAFLGINPCGFSTNIMTSVEAQLGKPIDRSLFNKVCEQAFRACLS